MRKFQDKKLVVATHNPGKAKEISALLKPFGVEIVTVGELGLPEPIEDGTTFEANAEIKALAAATASGLPALADDSGLSVAALDGDPGIYSARWAGPEKNFNMAMQAVADKIGKFSDKSAKFVCALTLAWPDEHCETFVGEVHGNIVWPARGDKGFGYDPIFIATGMTQTFAEIDPQQKEDISHRAHAFEQLVAGCFAP